MSSLPNIKSFIFPNVDFPSDLTESPSCDKSLAIKAASIPTDAAVPRPSMVPAAPDANSIPAPVQSPSKALCIANSPPAMALAIGIFFNADLPTFLPIIFGAIFSNADFADFDIIFPAPVFAIPFVTALVAIFATLPADLATFVTTFAIDFTTFPPAKPPTIDVIAEIIFLIDFGNKDNAAVAEPIPNIKSFILPKND